MDLHCQLEKFVSCFQFAHGNWAHRKVGILENIWGTHIDPMTDPWCWYINANIKGVFVDGIHGTPYIAAPWIRHGIYTILETLSIFVGGLSTTEVQFQAVGTRAKLGDVHWGGFPDDHHCGIMHIWLVVYLPL
jgi:hypothetical protein